MLVLTDPISSGRSGSRRAAVGGPGGLHLDRVAQRGAGAVRLEVVDVPARQAGASQRRGDKPLLRTAIGHGQAAGCAILVDRAARDDRADPVAVALRVAEPLEHQNPAAFTAHVAVGGGVEGLASPIGDSILAREAATMVTGLSRTFTPPASAKSQSPECNAWQA